MDRERQHELPKLQMDWIDGVCLPLYKVRKAQIHKGYGFAACYGSYSDPTRSIIVKWVKIFKTEKTIEIPLVQLTEVCGKVLSEKNANKSVKTALLLSNDIDADHQNSCLFKNTGHFSTPLWVLIGVLAKFYE